MREFCRTICKVLLPKYIKFPEGDELKRVVDGFKHKYGFPQCVGAIDGSHIPILSPQEYTADYYNRKGWHSVILQGTVNHLGIFTDAEFTMQEFSPIQLFTKNAMKESFCQIGQ